MSYPKPSSEVQVGKATKRDAQKKEEEEVIKRMEKIEINQQEKELEKVLRRAAPPSREKIAEVFKTAIGLVQRKPEKNIAVVELLA